MQRGAEALYSPEGRKQVRALIDHYMGNAKILRDAAADAGLKVFGGVNAPYIWVKTPDGLTSWEMFDRMLRELNVVITPGSRVWRARRRLLPHFCFQQPRECRGSSGAAKEFAVVVAAVCAVSAHRLLAQWSPLRQRTLQS